MNSEKYLEFDNRILVYLNDEFWKSLLQFWLIKLWKACMVSVLTIKRIVSWNLKGDTFQRFLSWDFG